MKYYDEIYSEIVPFKFMKYIILLEGGIGVVFLVLYVLQLSGGLGIEDELPQWYFLLMALIMLGVAAFLYNLRSMRIGITGDALRASLGFIRFSVPLSDIEEVYMDEKSSLKYGGWGVRMRKYKEGWVLAYTTIGYKRVVLKLKEHKYKRFIFSTAHPEEVVNSIKQQLR
jgi:hypothetical protein